LVEDVIVGNRFPQNRIIEQFCPVTSTDAFQRTSVPGVYAAGDNSALLRSVANSIGAGNIAGSIMNHDLITEEA
jgi:thioredoxin reductase